VKLKLPGGAKLRIPTRAKPAASRQPPVNRPERTTDACLSAETKAEMQLRRSPEKVAEVTEQRRAEEAQAVANKISPVKSQVASVRSPARSPVMLCSPNLQQTGSPPVKLKASPSLASPGGAHTPPLRGSPIRASPAHVSPALLDPTVGPLTATPPKEPSPACPSPNTMMRGLKTELVQNIRRRSVDFENGEDSDAAAAAAAVAKAEAEAAAEVLAPAEPEPKPIDPKVAETQSLLEKIRARRMKVQEEYVSRNEGKAPPATESGSGVVISKSLSPEKTAQVAAMLGQSGSGVVISKSLSPEKTAQVAAMLGQSPSFDDIDANSDGVIDRQEWANAMKEKYKVEPYESTAEETITIVGPAGGGNFTGIQELRGSPGGMVIDQSLSPEAQAQVAAMLSSARGEGASPAAVPEAEGLLGGESIVFEEDFKATLSEEWSWQLGEDARWSLPEGGPLRILGSREFSSCVRALPGGCAAVEATLSFRGCRCGEEAGLTWSLPAGESVKLVLQGMGALEVSVVMTYSSSSTSKIIGVVKLPMGTDDQKQTLRLEASPDGQNITGMFRNGYVMRIVGSTEFSSGSGTTIRFGALAGEDDGADAAFMLVRGLAIPKDRAQFN